MKFLDHFDAAHSNKLPRIDYDDPFLKQWVNGIEPATYTLIGADSGVGKTSYLDELCILRPYIKAKKEGKKLKIFYFSFELSKQRKMYKWLSFILNLMDNLRVSNRQLANKEDIIGTEEEVAFIKQKARERTAIVQKIMDDINFYDQPMNPTGIYKELIDYAQAHGTIDFKVIGSGKKIIEKYTPNDPDEIVLIAIDHLSLMNEESNLHSKEIMDRMSRYMVMLRNTFNYSCVFLQQFNTSLQSATRKKDIDERSIIPQRVDFSETTFTYRDADIVLSLVKPNDYGLNTFLGPNSNNPWLVPMLGDAFIAAYLMKNRDGPSKKIGLYYNVFKGHEMKSLPLDCPYGFDYDSLLKLNQ